MTDWIEHNGGPQPVADDVETKIYEAFWLGNQSVIADYSPARKQNAQVSIDPISEAAILHRGIRLGVLAAARSIFHEDDLREILSIDTLEVLKEFRDEQ